MKINSKDLQDNKNVDISNPESFDFDKFTNQLKVRARAVQAHI